MKRTLFVLILLATTTLAFAQAGAEGDKKKSKKSKSKAEPAAAAASSSGFTLDNRQDSLGYAIGLSIANDLNRQGFDMDIDAMFQAMKDVYEGKATLMKVEETQAFVMKCQQEARSAKSKAAQEKADKFLAENKTKPGVITLPSGLQYIVLKEGTGAQPSPSSSVTTHYHGTLLDGTVFDSSVDRGQPATFPVNGVIKAWQEMLVLMKEGGKVRLFCPPNLAYGEQGAGGKIGPNEMLIFEIELIKIN